MDMSVNDDSSAAFTSVFRRLDLLALLEFVDILTPIQKYSCRAASRLARLMFGQNSRSLIAFTQI